MEKIIGDASFTEDGCVLVDGQKYAAKHILIATGGVPVEANIPGIIISIGFVSHWLILYSMLLHLYIIYRGLSANYSNLTVKERVKN